MSYATESTREPPTGGRRDGGPGGSDQPTQVLVEDLPGDATTTTVVHPGARGRPEWWRRAVVYELTARELTGQDLPAVSSGARHASRLGADALLIHPRTPPDQDPEAAHALLRRTHQLGLRLLVSLPEHPDRLEVLRQWLGRGAEGVDLGPVPASPTGAAGRPPDVGEVQALVAAHTEDGVLSAAASATRPENLLSHLQEIWPHHLRDDRLVTARWSAPQLRRTITQAYAQRDPVGAPMAWTLHDPFGAARGASDPGPPPAPDRFRALALLTMALPGSLYLRQGEQVGATDGMGSAGPGAAERAEGVRALVAEQAGHRDSVYEMFRHALRLRRDLRLGSGPLAWVDGLRQATADSVLAFVNRQVLVLVNTGPTALQLPPTVEVLHASTALLPVVGGGVEVPPGATVWAQPSLR